LKLGKRKEIGERALSGLVPVLGERRAMPRTNTTAGKSVALQGGKKGDIVKGKKKLMEKVKTKAGRREGREER